MFKNQRYLLVTFVAIIFHEETINDLMDKEVNIFEPPPVFIIGGETSPVYMRRDGFIKLRIKKSVSLGTWTNYSNINKKIDK